MPSKVYRMCLNYFFNFTLMLKFSSLSNILKAYKLTKIYIFGLFFLKKKRTYIKIKSIIMSPSSKIFQYGILSKTQIRVMFFYAMEVRLLQHKSI